MAMDIVRGTNEQRAIFIMCWNNFDVHPPIDSHFEVFNISIGASCYIFESAEEFYDEERKKTEVFVESSFTTNIDER